MQAKLLFPESQDKKVNLLSYQRQSHYSTYEKKNQYKKLQAKIKEGLCMKEIKVVYSNAADIDADKIPQMEIDNLGQMFLEMFLRKKQVDISESATMGGRKETA